MSADWSLHRSPTARAGARDALPFAAAGFVVAISFGISARAAGLPALAAIAMSAFVYAGSAQFAAVAILGQGGSVVAAVLAAGLMNARYIAMGLAIGPSLKGGRTRRALEGQAVVDASWALANRGGGRFDRHALFGSSIPQYATWLGGTVVGVVAGSALPHPEALGIDVVFPAFFLALLVGELHDREAGAVAVGGAIVAVVLGLLAPAGVGILAASLVALAGLPEPTAMTIAEKAWLTVGLCTITTFAIRAFGPMAVGARQLGPRTARVLALLPAALLSALVVTETVIVDGELDLDARVVGVAFAGFLLWRGASVIWVVIGAAALTAALRLVF